MLVHVAIKWFKEQDRANPDTQVLVKPLLALSANGPLARRQSIPDSKQTPPIDGTRYKIWGFCVPKNRQKIWFLQSATKNNNTTYL